MAAELAERLAGAPAAAALVAQWSCVTADRDAPLELSGDIVAGLRRAAGVDGVALARVVRGEWETLADDHLGPLPVELLANVLDEETAQSRPPHHAVPLERGGEGLLLVLRGTPAGGPSKLDAWAAAALVGWRLVEHESRQRRRLERLEAILAIAAQWRQSSATDELLTQIAEASTRLLRAERASIFLWDRASHTLVGRPALGVEGGELRIGDHVGVVGAVVHSGQSRRVGADRQEQAAIDRAVDQQLQFITRTLLCVPLRAADGRMLGAFELINKLDGDFNQEDEDALTELAAHAALALENTQQYEQLLRSRRQMANEAAAEVQVIGDCPAIRALRQTLERVASTDLAVLILGENGTGKEVVSRRIHYLSPRRDEPLIAVNCAALPETLLESELFGHEKGAFTDARETRQGKFELASGGTLFLDEIGDMSLSGQAKLLRVLEEKLVVRVGGSTPIRTDVRVLAATNQDLAVLVRDKRFREDLYYRLNVVALELPPLRERGDDILRLAEYFLEVFCLRARRPMPQFSDGARGRLLAHSWPGNVRELRNMMERIAYLVAGERIEAGDLAFILAPDDEPSTLWTSGLSLADATDKFQQDYIQSQIRAAVGNMTEAADRLGLHRSNLYRKMRQLGMPTNQRE